ncbi:hypothetical protein [Alkaliphilus sp. B6464]|uniref:hypothetical protein n=1 Tax=Alkaliphilus sp. B6464 TaxID=2731219 RepID=UPI001BA55823|nr:hypothetical protein [Alkaliphilus sp. B6464]QUH22217.1 hypothetical protein HYG84_20125 [Alkaliphilus sp. B6464]
MDSLINVGQEIINPYVDIILDRHTIPVNICGIVSDIDYLDNQVVLEWNIRKSLRTRLELSQFTKLVELGILKSPESMIKKTEPVFQKGDIVTAGDYSGIIIDTRYSFKEEKWFYTILDVKKLLSGNENYTFEEDYRYLMKMEKLEGRFSRDGCKEQLRYSIEKL